MKNRLIIIGASGHGKVAADIALRTGYTDIAFLDDDPGRLACMDHPVIGKISDAQKYPQSDFFIAIGNPQLRERIQTGLIQAGSNVVTLIHPHSVIGKNVTIGRGSVVMAGGIINSGTTIAEGCIVNTGASVDHDNRLESYVHVSVGSHLAGTVTVGKSTWIGAGAVVSNNVQICSNCMIGAGAVVVRDIRVPGTYVGVPAKMVKGTSKN